MLNLHSCYVKELESNWTVDCAVIPRNLLIFVTKGAVVYWVDRQVFKLQAGDVLFIPAGSARGGTASEVNQRYAAEFSTGDNGGLGLPILLERRIGKVKIQNLEYFKQRFSLLNHNWMLNGPYRETFCSAVLLEMLSLVNHDMDMEKSGGKKRRMVETIKNYIRGHYQENIKLQQLAELCGRTPNYISYMFKEATGFSPIEYIQEVRIAAAKDLMLTECLSINEISEQTGFCDQAYFYRVFKKLTGCSPTGFLNKKLG